MSDRIARAFNRSWANRAIALDISEAFDRVWHAVLVHKRRSYGISGQIFALISSFLSNRRLWVVLDGKSSQEYPVNAGVPQESILGPTLFLLYIILHFPTIIFLMMLSLILLPMLMILPSTINVIRLLVLYMILHFATIMIFLMLSVILLPMLTILPSTLNMIKHLICGRN